MNRTVPWLAKPRWSELGRSAKAFRLAHATIAVLELGSFAYIWTCAVTRRRDRWLGAALVTLAVQGIGIIIGRGQCPLGPLQRQLGDATPLFELAVPPRAARAVFPILLGLTVTAVVLLLVRGAEPKMSQVGEVRERSTPRPQRIRSSE